MSISSLHIFLLFILISQDGEWTEEDYAALAKAMAKFPGGTPGRWDRIAHDIGRTAKEVGMKGLILHDM